MATFGTLAEFSGIVKDWSSYYERCEFYFVANKIDSAETKRAVFLSIVGDATYQLIRGLLSPKKLTTVPFAKIIATLNSHYTPQKNAIVERYRFNTCNRKTGQSVTNYIAELKELARFCDFGVTAEGVNLTPQLVLEENLRDRFVCGLGESRTQRRLLSETKLTYKSAVDIANAMELADEGASHLSGGKATSQVNQLFNKQCNSGKKKKSTQPNSTTKSKKPCYRCTGNHTTKNNEIFFSHFEQIFAVLLRSLNTLKMRKIILKLSFLKIILSKIFLFLSKIHLILNKIHLILSKINLILSKINLILSKINLILSKINLILSKINLILSKINLILNKIFLILSSFHLF